MWGRWSNGRLEGWRKNGIPILGGRAQPLDVGVETNHFSGGNVTRKVCIEAAGDFITAIENDPEPGRVGACSRGRDADTVGIEHAAADGIDGGFADYNPL